MKKNKFIVFILLIFVLTSCQNADIENSWNSDESENTVSTNSKSEDTLYQANKTSDYETTNLDSDDAKVLSISDKCIWCNKCVRISPENFAMDYETRKAIVISQKDKFSSSVSNAIKRCPVDAIEIL